jgi:hypothetical protein
VRFYMAGAGAEVNSTLFSIEYERPEALGRAADALGQDADLQAFATRVNRSDSPTMIISQSTGMELPLGRNGYGASARDGCAMNSVER